jgi:flagellin
LALICHFFCRFPKVSVSTVDCFINDPLKAMLLQSGCFTNINGFYQFEDFKMTVINTNIAASVTANAMKANQRTMETTMERLATGLRVNSATDDSAGLGIGVKMDSQIRGMEQGIRNANDGISMLQTVDGAAEQITGLLQRMRELSVQGTNGTNSTEDLNNLNEEFTALATEIDRIADQTTFNGTAVMNTTGGVTKQIVVGPDYNDRISVQIGDFNLAAGAAATQSTDSLTITQAAIRTVGTDTDAFMNFTNNKGEVMTVTQTQIAATDATSFADATVADLVSAFNTAEALITGFDAITATRRADGTGIDFQQDVAGTGSLASISAFSDAAVSLEVTHSVSRTVVGDSAALTPMGAVDMADFLVATNNSVENTGTLTKIDAAITGVNTARATFGANISRLGHAVDNLSVNVNNTMAAKSAIMDADYAAETTELARTQIIAQASTAMLSQANQQAQSVLALLKS